MLALEVLMTHECIMIVVLVGVDHDIGRGLLVVLIDAKLITNVLQWVVSLLPFLGIVG